MVIRKIFLFEDIKVSIIFSLIYALQILSCTAHDGFIQGLTKNCLLSKKIGTPVVSLIFWTNKTTFTASLQ
jgi:hypothetical protein